MISLDARRKTQSVKDGFTLIELLVVVAISSILAAILFPVFARARESARRASCMSNLKQIGFGVMMYKQDNDGYFPIVIYSDKYTSNPSRFNDNYLYWENVIYPYVKSTQLFICPSGVGTRINVGNYGANELIIGDPGYFNNAPFNDSILENPSETYMIFDAGTYVLLPHRAAQPDDSRSYVPGAGKILGITSWSGMASDIKDDFVSGRHFGGVNMAFADGHVKWLSSKTLVTESRKTSDCWNPISPTPRKHYPNNISSNPKWCYGHWSSTN